MDKIIWKLYYNYEEEEKWLNEMAAKGLALVSYSWCRYVFTECEPGEYIYRIELLPNELQHEESQTYIDFMQEAGAKLITSYGRWVYFRRKATEGAFDIYSDADSRISHYKRIMSLWGVIGICNLTVWISIFSYINFIAGILLTGLCIPYLIKIRKLKKEKLLRE